MSYLSAVVVLFFTVKGFSLLYFYGSQLVLRIFLLLHFDTFVTIYLYQSSVTTEGFDEGLHIEFQNDRKKRLETINHCHFFTARKFHIFCIINFDFNKKVFTNQWVNPKQVDSLSNLVVNSYVLHSSFCALPYLSFLYSW